LGDIAVDDGVGELERFLEDIVVEEATRVKSNNGYVLVHCVFYWVLSGLRAATS